MKVACYRQPEILGSIPDRGHAVIEASAGTGKTYALEHLVVHLLLAADVPIEKILVVTFTEKATQELRERLRAKLAELCELEAQEVEAAPPAGFWVLDADARQRLQDALFEFDSATITTIHGFCHRVLTEHAFDHGRLFQQQLVDSRTAFGRAFREVVREALAGDDRVRQVLARELEGGGSLENLESGLFECFREQGKLTPVWDPDRLTRACSRLVKSGSPQGGRSGKARRGMAQISGLARQFLTSGDAFAFAEEFADWVRGDGAGVWSWLRGGDESAGGGVAAHLAEIALCAATPLAFLAQELLPRVAGRLSQRKRALGRYDFDDMILQVRNSLTHPRRGPELAAALRSRYRFALIDEFQDTDAAQWEIFRTVFFESPDENRFFVIGDPKQAIYRFRNADVQTYRRARQSILDAGGSLVPLRVSFRSTAGLLDAHNRIFRQGFFSGDNDYGGEVTCGKPELAAVQGHQEAVIPVCLVHLVGRGLKLRIATVRQGLGDFIAAEVGRLLDPDRGLRIRDGDVDRRLEARNIHLLTRTSRDAREIGAVLRRHQIPHAYYREEGLFQTDEALDTYLLLRSLTRPQEPSARLQAWLTPFFDVPLADLPACRDLPDTHPLVERLLAWKARADALDYPGLFRSVLRESGVVRRALFSRPGERELTNYLHIFEILLEETHKAPKTLSEVAALLKAFIDQRAFPPGADGNVQRLESEEQAVQILTMHKAKGLEADVVFVAGGFTKGFGRDSLRVYHLDGERHAHIGRPWGAVADAIVREEREEEERLLYVALTRAKVRLYLPYFGPPVGPAEADHHYGFSLTGPYKHLHGRLESLVSEGVLDEADAVFARQRVECGEEVAAEMSSDDLRTWDPDPRLLEPSTPDEEELRRLKRRHAPVILTSYTRLRRPSSVFSPESTGDELAAEAEIAEAGAPAEDGLPGGRNTGIFLHTVLEELEYLSVRRLPRLEAWLEEPEVDHLFTRLALRHALDLRHLSAAKRLVHRALTLPVDLGRLALPGGLCTVERRVAEMELLYPIPEASHPRLGIEPGAPADDRLPFAVGRGFIQGVVDLVFEHDDVVYFLDWKSDRLAGWDRDALERHVTTHYELQARLYALGVVRLLGVRSAAAYDASFGGLLYCFLRGMAAGEPAIWFRRPAWPEIRTWEEELLERQDWGAPNAS